MTTESDARLVNAGMLSDRRVTSAGLKEPVTVAVYTPPGYDEGRPQRYPLLIQLHGGDGSSEHMKQMAPVLDVAIAQGLIPPVVSVMPSVGRSFYMDYRDGSQNWESFVLGDLIAHMRETMHVVGGREGTLITGVSMGGMGSLRMAFKHPEMFQAVAAMEPAIEPALAYDDIQLRDRFWRSDDLFQQIYGSPVDRDYWADNNPTTIASAAPDRLLGLGIYLEVGDQDFFYLNHGAEFLHRILFDAGISHEYRLVKGGDHVGPSLAPRFLDALGFLGRILEPPVWVDVQVKLVRDMVDELKTQAGYPVIPVDPDRVHRE